MKRHKVESSNIAEVGYDPYAGTLEIKFLSGAIYQYEMITEHEFACFMHAESMGSFFAEHFKKLPFKKMDQLMEKNLEKETEIERDGVDPRD